MMRIIYLVVCLFCCSPFLDAQVRAKPGVEKNISLPFNADIVSINAVKNKFFVIKTASNYLRKSTNNVLHYFSSDLTKTWSLPIKTKENESAVIASEFTPFIYHIEGKYSVNLPNVYTRIDAAGKATRMKLSSSINFPKGERKIAYFSTTNKLCMLSFSDFESTRQTTITVNKKKTSVTLGKSYLVLHTIDHSGKKLTGKKLKIAFESSVSNAPVHVELLGQEDSIFYLLKKERTKNLNEMVLTIYEINELGDLKNTWSWTANASFDIMPIFNVREANGAYVENLDYKKDVSQSHGTMGGPNNQVNTTTTTITTTVSAGSYGTCYLDLLNDEFYFVCFTDDVLTPASKSTALPMSSLKAKCKQMRIQIYQFSSGELLDEKVIQIPSEIKKDRKWGSTKIMGVNIMDMGRSHFRISLIGLHKIYAIYFNSVSKNISFLSREAVYTFGRKSLNERYNHQVFRANLMLHTEFSSSEFAKYLKGFSSWNTNQFSINGIDLGKNIVVVKNGAYSSRNSTVNLRVFAK